MHLPSPPIPKRLSPLRQQSASQRESPHAIPERSLVVALVFVCIVATSFILTSNVPGPGFASDEFGYLANARFLADAAATPNLDGAPFYSIGYSLLLSIPYALGASPETAFRTGLMINGLLCGGLFLLLLPIAREICSLSRYPAIAASAVVALFPPVILNSGIAWAESTLWLLAAGWGLTGWYLIRRRSLATALLFASMNVLLFLTHGRAAALLLVGSFLLISMGVRRLLPWKYAGIALGVIGSGAILVRAVERHVQSAIYGEGLFGDGGAGGAVVETLMSPESWGTMVIRTAGQLWYIGVATAGLALIGWFLLLLIALRDRDLNRRLWSVLVIGGSTAMLIVSSAFTSSGPADRIDKLFYGRYMEVAASIPLLFGIAWLLRPVHPSRRLVTAAGTMGLITALGVTTIIGSGSGSFDDGLFHPGTVLGVVFPSGVGMGGTGVDFDPVRTTVVGVAATLTLCIVAMAVRGAAVALLAVAFLISSFAVQNGVIRPIEDALASSNELRRSPILGEATRIAFDKSNGTEGSWSYQFWLDDSEFVFFNSETGEAPPTDIVIASVEWAPTSRAARPIAYSRRVTDTAWVMQGDEARRLARSGSLPGPLLDSPLSSHAAHASLRLLSPFDDAPLVIESGDDQVITVVVRHAGAESSWRQALYYPAGEAPGYVYLEPWIVGPAGVRVEGRAGQLPRTMPPGDSAPVTTTIAARDDEGAPLAPGQYSVELQMAQSGHGSFKSLSGQPPIQVPLVVTPEG